MKVTIVKDDNLKTIGVLVTDSNNKTLVNWGIHPSEWTFCKRVSVSDNLQRIFKLAEMQAKLRYLEDYSSMWFDTAIHENADRKFVKTMQKNNEGVCFGKNKEEIDNLKKRIEDLVNEIK